MIYNFGKTTSSHVPVLMEFLKVFRPRLVMEYGGGVFSTEIFLKSKSCYSLTTLETHGKWCEFIRKRYSSFPGHLIAHFENKELLSYVKELRNGRLKYDLVFVDTQNKIRVPLIELSTKITDNIICHDTQAPFLKKIQIGGFQRINFVKPPCKYKNGKRPWTSLFTRNPEVYKHFTDIAEDSLYKKYPFPYGIKK